uniref:Uncharacterized protein n=1 Tax=Neogobius melanostomus TaxID=47308 RepID=A0A8C6SPS3_9GOBI
MRELLAQLACVALCMRGSLLSCMWFLHCCGLVVVCMVYWDSVRVVGVLFAWLLGLSCIAGGVLFALVTGSVACRLQCGCLLVLLVTGQLHVGGVVVCVVYWLS